MNCIQLNTGLIFITSEDVYWRNGKLAVKKGEDWENTANGTIEVNNKTIEAKNFFCESRDVVAEWSI
jgi:hypothetical protein